MQSNQPMIQADLRSGRPFNRDMIKYFAMLTMTLSHVAHMGIIADPTIVRIFKGIGYFTLITMVYFLVDGFDYTHDKRAYGKRLFLFACLSQAPFMLAFFYTPATGFAGIELNVLFNLFFCFRILMILDSDAPQPSKCLKILIYLALSMVSDWLILAPIFTLLFRWAKRGRLTSPAAASPTYQAERNHREILAYLACLAALTAVTIVRNIVSGASGIRLDWMILIGPILSLLVICFGYNGRKGKHAGKFSKWFFYIYYPAHIAVIAVLRIFVL